MSTTPADLVPTGDVHSPGLPSVVADEAMWLRRVRRRLIENPEPPGASVDEIAANLIRLRDEARQAKAEDRPAIYQQMAHLEALLDQLRRGRPTERVDPDSPYFGHLRLREGQHERDIFLGKATRLDAGLQIVDWRNAPVSKLFYRYREGDEYVEEMAGRVREGRIAARRTVHVQDGTLMRVSDDQTTWLKDGDGWVEISRDRTRLHGGAGQAFRAGTVRSRLGAGNELRADKHLPEIAALIDPDQFELITAPDSGVVVLTGSAGSGKTTVALHRIAYLHYAFPDRFRPERIQVIVWGRAMRDYIAQVLPALGGQGVKVDTWEDWARERVRQHFPFLPHVVAEDTPASVMRMKLHPGTAELLQDRVRRRRARGRAEAAVEDWARTITDREGLARALRVGHPDEALDEAELERAIEWCTAQAAAAVDRIEGDRNTDLRLDAEDDALLLRAYQLRVGPLCRRGRPIRMAHLVLDEVQDFAPVEVQVLLDTCDAHRSVTLAGDHRQQMSEEGRLSSWQDFLNRIGVPSTALSTLEVSYRSTTPIVNFAHHLLAEEDSAPPPRATREGPPVELFRFTEHGACIAFLAEELARLVRTEPLANLAVIAPNPELARLYYEGLCAAEVPELRLVEDEVFAFAPGVDVVDISQVKGLEFDYVVVVEATAQDYPDTPYHRRRLHVASTRAVHQLWLTAVGTPSPILPRQAFA